MAPPHRVVPFDRQHPRSTRTGQRLSALVPPAVALREPVSVAQSGCCVQRLAGVSRDGLSTALATAPRTTGRNARMSRCPKGRPRQGAQVGARRRWPTGLSDEARPHQSAHGWVPLPGARIRTAGLGGRHRRIRRSASSGLSGRRGRSTQPVPRGGLQAAMVGVGAQRADALAIVVRHGPRVPTNRHWPKQP